MIKLSDIADLISLGRIEDAYDAIIKTETDFLHDATYWNLRGMLCSTIDEFTSAIDCFQKAINIDTTYSDAYYNYAYALEKVGNLSDSALYNGLAYRYAVDEEVKAELLELYSTDDTLRDIFMEASMGINKHYIILSSCPWSHIYQRMHHIARSLRKLGHDVSYINPVVQVTVNEEVSLSNLISYSFSEKSIVDGVSIYTPFQTVINNGTVINNYTHLVQQLLNLSSGDNDTVIITYLPYQVNVIKELRGKFTHIYECVDDHSDLEYAFWGTRKDVLWEQELMDKADAITTTATSLFLQRSSIEERNNVCLSRNAVNEADFIIDNDAQLMPDDLSSIPEPRIVYTGVVYNRFDEDLFYGLVESNPDKSFVIIGPVQDGLLSKKLPNLYLLGSKKHSELKYYLAHMQIGIVPYIDAADMDIACDSIKQYEYIACGLPVITTYMPESGIRKIYTYLANTVDEFNIWIKKCLKLKIPKEEKQAFLAENSWNARAALLCRLTYKRNVQAEYQGSLNSSVKELEKLVQTYDWPIFGTLLALCEKNNDMNKYLELTKAAYDNNPNIKFAEREYLRALFLNRNYTDYMKTVEKSKFIADELKAEVVYRFAQGDLQLLKVLFHFTVADFKKSLELISRIVNAKIRLLFTVYVKHVFGEINSAQWIELVDVVENEAALFKYLNDLYGVDSHLSSGKVKNVYIADVFNTVTKEIVDIIEENKIDIDGICNEVLSFKYDKKCVPINGMLRIQRNKRIQIIVPYDMNYVKQIRTLAEAGVTECYVALVIESNVTLVHIEEHLMEHIKNKEYNKTVNFNKFHAADSNVHALIKHLPKEYAEKYNIEVIYGKDVWTVDNIVKVPLRAAVTVSGFATFLYNYPKFTYNIEVGHGGVSLKACGLMDKKDKRSGGTPELFEKVDRMLVASDFHKLAFSAAYALSEDKYDVTGLPRNDLLFKFGSTERLEKLLGVKIKDNKVIFNMPTFHVYDDLNRVEGSASYNDAIKIPNFDYEAFNSFLLENDIICVSKVHHGEEKSISEKNIRRRFSNLFFVTNKDLEEKGLDLYEVLGAGDLLLTDYSSVYNDFLYMDKPTIFVIPDIEEYRQNRGIALEPYDFWTAGPKVNTQNELQMEILSCLQNQDYFKEERERLLPLFFSHVDNNAISRAWAVIDNAFTEVTNS